MHVDIEELYLAMAVLKRFNLMELKDVELYEDGEMISVAPEAIERFRITGLSNKDFVRVRYWENWKPLPEKQS